MEELLKFENFTFQYNAQTKPTLIDINLTVHKGEKILIAGPSGCGKSTLIHCINGLIPFSYKGENRGRLTLKGKDTNSMSLFEISKSVGTVLQDSDSQFVGMTVAEDIAFALENDCVGEPKLHDTVNEVAGLVNVEKLLDHAPTELSGGQKQRVSVAGVMVDDVDLLLFDEPLANLDPATGKQAVELIDNVGKRTGAAVIIVEHRLEDALYKDVDRIVLMYEGRIIRDCTPDELLSESALREHGIREPLYITALKYSNVSITPDMKPGHIDTIRLSAEDKRKVFDFYESIEEPRDNNKREKLLEAYDISFTYKEGQRPVLKNINLSIDRGEMVAIVGTNGAGKSTFSKVICGFEPGYEGKLTFAGEDFDSLSIKERAEHIGFVLQNPNQMISKVMIMDEVAMGLRLRGANEEEIAAKTEQALRICGLWKFRNWPISALSFGQKKRVTIASILTLDPEMIILDEPTAGQDYRHYTEIMDFLKEINNKGVTVLMITHDMHLMLEYAERAVVFSDGRIIADDSCASIITNPDIVREASLKETSLYELAKNCGIKDGTGFVRRFIDYERTVVNVKEGET